MEAANQRAFAGPSLDEIRADAESRGNVLMTQGARVPDLVFDAKYEDVVQALKPDHPQAFHNEVPVARDDFKRMLSDPEAPMVIDMKEEEVVGSLNRVYQKAREIVVPSPDTLVPVGDVQIDTPCNTSEEDFLRNVLINGARSDVPWLHVVPEHYEHAVLIGGGASLEIQLHEVASRMRLGQTLFALNGSAKYLKDRHMEPDVQVVIDSRPECIEHLRPLAAKRFILSSGCHPTLFQFLVDQKRDVMMFHMPHLGLAERLPKGRNVVMVGGEYTVGLTAMSLACALGFRSLHLYGYDSSDSDDGRAHAYPQSQNEAEAKRLHIVCAGRKFVCSFAMFKQAEVFPRFASMLADFGCTVSVNGDGLLPTVARQMVTYAAEENAACYNMANGPASFDFITWLVVAEMDRVRRNAPAPLKVAFTAGPEEGFRGADVQSTPEKQQILDHVMRPALKLFGAIEDDTAATGRQYHYWYRPITDGFRVGEQVPRCKPPSESVLDVIGWLLNNGIRKDVQAPLIITLRETRYSPARNSNLDSWLEFARRRRAEGEIVVFVRDTKLAEEPLNDFLICPRAARELHFRAALYSLAKCNLIIANGPAELLQFSEWPFIEFKPPSIDPLRPVSLGISWWQRFAGITPPESFPWLGKHQLTVWQRDTVENLEVAWLRWKAVTEN